MVNKNYINIYNNLIKYSRNKSIFSYFTKKDTFSDRLLIFFFHFGFFLKEYKKTQSKDLLQEVFDYVIRELEISIREIGYGDASINKKMKTYINTFHSLLIKIDLWENINDSEKEDLLRSFFNYKGDIVDLSKYFEKYRLFLLNSSLNLFSKGVIKPDL